MWGELGMKAVEDGERAVEAVTDYSHRSLGLRAGRWAFEGVGDIT